MCKNAIYLMQYIQCNIFMNAYSESVTMRNDHDTVTDSGTTTRTPWRRSRTAGRRSGFRGSGRVRVGDSDGAVGGPSLARGRLPDSDDARGL